MQQLLRLTQVRERVGLSRSEIYRLMSLGRFPQSIPLGERARAWPSDLIAAWIESRIAAQSDKRA
jgi:prophage regulatory protein